MKVGGEVVPASGSSPACSASSAGCSDAFEPADASDIRFECSSNLNLADEISHRNSLSHCSRAIDPQNPEGFWHHLCRVENPASIRRPSLRTRSISSVSQGSSSPSGSSDIDSGFVNSDNSEIDCDCLFSDATNPKRLKLTADASNSEGYTHTMGCPLSTNATVTPTPKDKNLRRSTNGVTSSCDEEDDFDEGHQQPGKVIGKDIGLKSVSNADLLDVQREASPEVTRCLEDRWIRSHFLTHDAKGASTGAHSLRRKPSQRPRALSLGASNGSKRIIDVVTSKENLSQQQGPTENARRLSILHFNDVYEISERKAEPVGGAARFATAINEQVDRVVKETGERPLIIFAGDCLNPSTLSCATQGEHMIKVLNQLKVDVAVFGNHEFDFGVEHAVKCISKMQSTWLLSNVIDQLTNRNLVEGKTKVMMEHNGLKIGFVGLVEEEWLDTLTTVDKSNLAFTDYVQRGQEIAADLRENGADFVIALTHMRWPNDIRLAEKVPDIDLVLGGHDHEYGVKKIDECLVIKSGSDFRNFSSIDAYIRDDGCVDVKLARFDITKQFRPDDDMSDIVDKYMSNLEASLDKKIGEVLADLDGNFGSVRTGETRLGNFVADIMASVTRADIVLINSGTFRSDGSHPRGDFRLDDLMKILPISDTVITIEVTGQQLLDALENGVSKLPKKEGRFPQVSGMSFGFNKEEEAGKRVVRESVRVGGAPVDLNRTYTMATKAYVARGKDGYQCLKKCRIRADPDSSPLLSTVVRNHVKNVYKLRTFEREKSCTISVSTDGRTLTSDGAPDPLQAFVTRSDDDDVSPLSMIRKSMVPLIEFNNSVAEGEELAPDRVSAVHSPNFIAFSNEVIDHSEPLNEDDRKLAELRRRALPNDGENWQLLRERRENPHELRWQVLPLLEARIFHCTRQEL